MRIQIDFNVLARIAKFVALFAFFLPWVAVSCAGQEIATGTGWEWMTGHLQPSGALAGMAQSGHGDATQGDMGHQDPAYILIAAFAAIAIGLIAGSLTRQRVAAAIMLVSSLSAIGLSFYTYEYIHSKMMDEANRSRHAEQVQTGDNSITIDPGTQREVAQAAANAIKIEKKEGFWVTIVSLAIAALLSLLSVGGLRLTASSSNAAPPNPS